MSVALIIIGYTIGILATSIGISITNNAKDFSVEMTHGYLKNQRQININNEDETFDYYNLINDISQNCKNSQVEIIGVTQPFDNNDVVNPNLNINPTIYNGKPIWQMDLLQGRYLTPKETQSDINIAVVGKKVAQKYSSNKLKEDFTINILGKEYKVVGVMGNANRNSPSDTEVLIPLKSFDLQSGSKIDIIVHGDENIDNNLNRLKEKITVDKIKENQDNSMVLTSAGASLVAFLILFTTVANISNLSCFWILSRKNEIAIKKALGAEEKIVIYDVIIEIVLMAIIGAVIALLIQITARYFLENLIDNLDLKVKLNNFTFGIGVSLICGLISSLTPVRETLKIQPADAVKVE